MLVCMQLRTCKAFNREWEGGLITSGEPASQILFPLSIKVSPRSQVTTCRLITVIRNLFAITIPSITITTGLFFENEYEDLRLEVA